LRHILVDDLLVRSSN